jgi:hypothetical protein
MEPIRKNIREKFMLSKVLEHFVRIKVGLCSGCDSDATDLRCRFQHRYPIAATTHIIAHYRWRNFSSQGSSQAVAAELKLF